LDESTLEAVLAKGMAHGAEFAEVFAEKLHHQGLSLESKHIREASGGDSVGVGIRVIHGEEVGYVVSEDLSRKALCEAAYTAAHIAQHGGSQGTAVRLRPLIAHPNRYPFRADIASQVLFRQAAQWLHHGAEAAYEYDPAVQEVIGHFVQNRREVLIANTEGLFAHDVQGMMRFSFYAIAERSSEKHTGFSGGGGRRDLTQVTEEQVKAWGKEASRMALAQMGAKPAVAGSQTVVLSPGWSGIFLHEAVGHGLEADFIAKGSSLYTGQVGERVAAPGVTVIDSGTLPHARGSLNIDDEGSVPEETVLIEDGILRQFLTCRLSAAALGLPRTGNGRRESYAYPPMPRMTNTYMHAGAHAPEEILASVKTGLYCAAFGGGQVDISNGNFVFEVREGYRIESGKLTHPVANATLIGIGPQALQKVTMIGNDLLMDAGMGTCGKDGQSVPVGVGLPTLRIDDIVVGGADVGAH
jgi:TldD protein